jgi:hypothetical protein
VSPLLILVRLADERPPDEDVVAGPIGALIFVVLILAVAFLARSMLKRLRNAQAAEEAGVYGSDPVKDDDADQ